MKNPSISWIVNTVFELGLCRPAGLYKYLVHAVICGCWGVFASFIFISEKKKKKELG